MPQKTKREKCKLVADLLNGAFLKWQMQLGAPVSQNQWAKRIGVPNTSYSHWVNEIRLPTGDNIHRLAAEPLIGYELYDVLEEPRRMPEDPELKKLMDSYRKATPTNRKRALEVLENNSPTPQQNPTLKEEGGELLNL